MNNPSQNITFSKEKPRWYRVPQGQNVISHLSKIVVSQQWATISLGRRVKNPFMGLPVLSDVLHVRHLQFITVAD